MKIVKLKLENIKCFREIYIPFKDNGEIKNWSLIAGDNGQGKTTILRSIAVGLCDKEGASALLAELHGGFLRGNQERGSIEICLEDKGKKFTVKTQIESDRRNESISQEIYQGDCIGKEDGVLINGGFKEREDIFAVAYGSGRSITGTESYEEYALVDSVYNLFNYEPGLQNAELGASRVKINAADQWEKLHGLLKKILMFKSGDKITLSKRGLYIKNTQWGEVSFNALSDGYKSLTSVILDFLSWKLLSKENLKLNDLSGIFIIDEIEQHLHPRWQRSIISILSRQFPKVQFICSTHTPICTLGLSDLKCSSQLIKVAYVNGHSEAEVFDLKEDFKGYRSDQILTSKIFGLPETRSLSIEEKLEEYSRIYLKEEEGRTEEEKKKFDQIKKELKELPMWDSVKDQQERKKIISLIENQESSSNDKNQ